jgi:peptidoglycan/xylan/chitin deacetylase (PgdA/CDA1 family)
VVKAAVSFATWAAVLGGPWLLFVSLSTPPDLIAQEAPGVAKLSAFERAAFRRFPSFRDAVPVLTYHHISSKDGYLSPTAFAEQMAMLHEAGFTSIGADQFKAFLRDGAPLPRKPVLITFDDGIESVWTQADPVLKRYGMRAVVFVITSQIGKSVYYLNQEQLRAVAASGRWDLESHSRDGHRFISADGRGSTGPFFTTRQWTGTRVETDREFEGRIASDLAGSVEDLRSSGAKPELFAFPFSAGSVSDPEVTRRLRRVARKQFRFTFINGDAPHYIGLADAPFELMNRFLVAPNETAESLFERLRAAVPLRPSLPDALTGDDLWHDSARQAGMSGGSLDNGRLRLVARPREWREVLLAPRRTVGWRDYEVNLHVAGLGGPGAETTAVVTIRRQSHPLRLSGVSVSLSAGTVMAAGITPAGATEQLDSRPLVPADSHWLRIRATGERLRVGVDGDDLMSVEIPTYRHGGTALGIWRASDASPQLEFSEMSVAPMEATR